MPGIGRRFWAYLTHNWAVIAADELHLQPETVHQMITEREQAQAVAECYGIVLEQERIEYYEKLREKEQYWRTWAQNERRKDKDRWIEIMRLETLSEANDGEAIGEAIGGRS